MENKINIAELLKDCPKGMELDCTMFDNLFLNNVNKNDLYPIMCYTIWEGIRNSVVFTEFGEFNRFLSSKCVIFPKGKTTWEGFVPPCKFKDGDVVVAEDAESFQLFLLKHLTYSENDNSYDGYCYFGWNFQCNELFEKGNWALNRLATEEEKQKLFNAFKKHGYKWNEETKTLEKLIEPKFKVGDRVKRKEVNYIHIVTIVEIDGEYYTYVNQNGEPAFISIKNQDKWELVPNKFDINTLKPFESKVLVRDYDDRMWNPAFWGKYLEDSKYSYLTSGGCYKQCIPYEGNEHLLGTTIDCDEFYKTW